MTRSGLLLSALLLTACGGSDPGPQPLKYHFDDMHIAAVPMTDKQHVVNKQNEYSIAKMERAKAESDFTESATKLEVAQNERGQALLTEKSARSEKRAADKTADMTRINKAAGDLRAAELGRRAADEKVTWLKVQRGWLRKQLRYTEENMYAQEAAFELAKANVAKGHNIQPRGLRHQDFERQAEDRAKRAQRWRGAAEKDRGSVDARKNKYESVLREANRAKGVGVGGDAGGSN